MKEVHYPSSKDQEELLKRPVKDVEDLDQAVHEILDKVRSHGDKALLELTKDFDKVELKSLEVLEDEFKQAEGLLTKELKDAIVLAKNNIHTFHQSQQTDMKTVESIKGVTCWRKSVPIERVGFYIPAGTAPLFSTILMLAVPANIAGCKEIVVCTPSGKDGTIHPAILYTAKLSGITQIFKVGGAQAIGAMAYGTESVPKVDKIFGPGNQYVTKAKELVQQAGVAIDMPAGPSEVLVVADQSCNPEFVAADLLSQAEHGEDSQVVLLSDNENVLKDVKNCISKQIKLLPRQEVASKALENSYVVLFNTLNDCIDFSNRYAPEHLILAVENPYELTDRVVNAGSVFVGHYSCESAGDYASGTNHVLPTNGYAKSYSGVSLDSFTKKITFQELTKEGIKNIGPAIELMAEAEGLHAHKNAVSVRMMNY